MGVSVWEWVSESVVGVDVAVVSVNNSSKYRCPVLPVC